MRSEDMLYVVLMKDTWLLLYIAKDFFLPEVADFLKDILNVTFQFILAAKKNYQ